MMKKRRQRRRHTFTDRTFPLLNYGIYLDGASTLYNSPADRLLGLLQSDTAYTCRYVGYAICLYEDGDHTCPYGVALTPSYELRKEIAVSVRTTPNLSITTQHELSHTLGANDFVCDVSCIMNYEEMDINTWCYTCKNMMREYIHTWLT